MTVSAFQLLKFVREKHPYAKKWPIKTTLDWLMFFQNNDFLWGLTGDKQKIDGLVLFRTVMTPEEGADESKINYDPEGNVIWVDFLYATSRNAMKGLWVLAINRVGERGFVAWERERRMSVWPLPHIKDRVLGKEHATNVI